MTESSNDIKYNNDRMFQFLLMPEDVRMAWLLRLSVALIIVVKPGSDVERQWTCLPVFMIHLQ